MLFFIVIENERTFEIVPIKTQAKTSQWTSEYDRDTR